MVRLARAIVKVIVLEYGRIELLRRLSDPYWFQALGNVLGFDWHSSGVTTVVTGALREALGGEELGVVVCGGKGRKALETPREVVAAAEKLGLPEFKIRELVRASRLTAKVDNAALQDGYTIYHHAMVVTEEGAWAVIQQGMNEGVKLARRYHWLSEGLESFVREPHAAIVGERREEAVLNMVALESEGARKASVDLAKEGPRRVARLLAEAQGMATLDAWLGGGAPTPRVKYLRMPWRVNWDALKRAYEIQPSSYEELLLVRGIGPSTVRALALISSLIYGEEVSWRDPVKYSFAFGGKDGVPYPVRIDEMERAIALLEESIRMAEVGERERLEALRRLRIFVDKVGVGSVD